MKYLESLNDRQKEAVLHTEGPLMILAGAGAGKTKTITHRIAHLIATGTPAESILAVTFTNKAAGEMRERVVHLLETLPEAQTPLSPTSEGRLPTVATFHALGVRILRENAQTLGLSRSFVIWDRADSIRAIKTALTARGMEKQYEAKHVLGRISKSKGDGITCEAFAPRVNSPWEQAVADIWIAYDKALHDEHALDFDDLLLRTLILLRDHEAVREKYQRRWTHIMVDEYQDTNGVQYEIMRLLAGEKQNVCVVGDIDQCVVAGTHITMADGTTKTIERMTEGELVRSNYGNGDMRPARILRTHMRMHEGGIVRITTRSGRILESTPEHMHFAGYRLGETPQTYFTYLMHKQGYGWRIGTSQVYTHGQKRRVIGFEQRAAQEHADAVWVIATHSSKNEAAVHEYQLSLRYRIPTIPFVARDGQSVGGYVHDQDAIDAIFASLDTEHGARELLTAYGLSHEYPHHRAQSRDSNRHNLTITLCGDRRGASPMHRLAMVGTNTTDAEILARAGLSIRPAKAESTSWRFETARADYGELMEITARVCAALPDTCVVTNARLGMHDGWRKNTSLPLLPAASLRSGMALFCENGEYDIVEKVETIEKKIAVYDLDIERTHNFIANGIVTHNSIYSWRGADISHLLTFEKTFPNTKVVLLEQNYRSTKTIIAAANDVIALNKNRFEKNLFTENVAGEPIVIYSAFGEGDEARFIATRINEQIAHGTSPHEIAILYRANFQSRALEEALLQSNLPYRVLGTRFFDRAEIKDVLSYMRAALNPASRIDLARIVASPPRGIGKGTLAHMLEGTTDQLSGAAQKKVGSFMNLLSRINEAARTEPVSQVLRMILTESGLETHFHGEGEEGLERIENIKELVSLATRYDDMEAQEGAEALLESAALASEQDSLEHGTRNTVSLMTVHASKGLEFNVVYITGLEDGLFPHEKFDEEADTEEERRLFYVALTRARTQVFLTHAATRMMYGTREITTPSPFLEDIAPEYRIDLRAAERQEKPQARKSFWDDEEPSII